MRNRIRNTKNIILNNKKVIENYFFMTVLQVLNSLFYLIIYPFLIRKLGAESYGLYVFALSIASYVTVLVNFGFTNPAVREVSLNRNDKKKLSNIVSSILTAQSYFFLIAIIILAVIILIVPFLYKNYILYIICALASVSTILFPTWFFQGIEQMKFITIIQLLIKVLSLPLIFIFIHSAADVVVFATINTVSSILGSMIAIYLIIKKWEIRLKLESLTTVLPYIKDALPFFWGSSASIIKMQSTSFFAGAFISMSSVALYDLANKLVMFIATTLSNVNNVLFPKIVNNNNKIYVKKALLLQTIISMGSTLLLILSGNFLIELLGGNKMIGAYPILIILSIIIPSWLIVGAIQLFIIIPMKKYKYVTISQTMAFVIYMTITILGGVVFKSIYWIAFAMSISAISELIYNMIIKRRLIINPEL